MKKIILILFCFFVMQNLAYAQAPTDYLILQNIVNFNSDGKGKCGNGSGILGGAGHFDEDHIVTTCRTDYYSFQQKMAVEIKVEQHTGGDSDRWLLHEIEDSYRSIKMERMGLLTNGTVMRKIDSQRVLWIGLGGGSFAWLSNNVVVKITYTDLQATKPEPIEVVKAYLAKFPSTIALTDADFKSNAHNVKWIKDEIDRRLWLCDKWNAQFQSGKTTQKDLLDNLVDNMEVFLNYREKYFSDIKAVDEISALYGLQKNNDATSIQKKLTEYKTWWTKHKGKGITLP